MIAALIGGFCLTGSYKWVSRPPLPVTSHRAGSARGLREGARPGWAVREAGETDGNTEAFAVPCETLLDPNSETFKSHPGNPRSPQPGWLQIPSASRDTKSRRLEGT